MSWVLTIGIILIGLVLVSLEIVALPGGVSGICGGIMVVIGIWQTYVHHGTTVGNITLVASIVVGITLLAVLLKSKTWKRFSLDNESDSKVNEIDNSVITIGAKGKTVSRLAPAGKAIFENEIVEVHSTGEFIEENQDIEVIEIEGYRIVVRKV